MKNINRNILGADKIVKIIPLTFYLVVWLLLSFYEYALLKRIDAQSIFLFDNIFFEHSMRVPAGFLGYIGSFLTQFFYYPPLGAAIYVALLSLTAFLVRKVFNVPARWAFLVLIPLSFLLAVNTQLGYWIYYIKFQGYYFVPVLGAIVALSAIWLFNKASYKWHIPVIVFWTAVGYPLFGFYALFSSACMALLALSLAVRNGNRMRIIFDGVATVVVATALIIEVPLLWYGYYTSMAIEFIHTAGLPSYHWDITADHFTSSIITYWLPYLFLFVSIVAFSVAYKMNSREAVEKHRQLITACLLLLSFAFVYFYWYKDTNYRIENKQDLAMWQNKWRKVADYARETELPSRQIVMNKNIAILSMGTAGEEMFKYPDGSADIDAPIAVHLTHTGGIMSYYCYGKFNFAYRWCVENAVEMGWKVEYLKHAVRCMLLQNEYAIAKRYINILKKTLFHEEWACRYEKYLDNPALIAKEKEFELPLQMCKYPDALDVDDSFVEAFLLQNISTGVTMEHVPVYNEAALMFSLIRKDVKLFWKNLSRYFYKRKINRLPTHYQEAILLFSNLDRSIDVSNLPIENSVRLRFNSFMNRTKRYKGMKEPEMAPLFKDDFGDTYWYFYFFVRNIKTN